MSTVEDQLALKDLMDRYVDAVYRSDADAWAATWAEDAYWNLVGTEAQGRDNIVTLWLQMMASFEFALMMPNSSHFEVTGDQATGHWYLQEYTRDSSGQSGMIVSRYLDTYSRVEGQWLYQSRRYELIYQGPADFAGTYTPPA
jgi:ketosteroid isomerase-like protein